MASSADGRAAGQAQTTQIVTHPALGEGVVLGAGSPGFLRVFFRTAGEHQVPESTLAEGATWTERVVARLRPATPEAVDHLRLSLDAASLPLSGSATRLTSAKIDLLPHQVVLVHRVATAQPRRFLVADEVGLGKTIQTALIIRELIGRGELTRALIVVPAGLVENWRREMNEVFNLDFEVFGSEGDVTDRKSNAFARHHRLIASIDTLKRPARIQRLREADRWDLVVFDEAQHLTVYKQGRRVRRTENFKLAQALRDHCRDLVLLSATPHQGDHFRFWQLVALLHPGLFQDERDMVDNRHRLNAVVIRRTKADACDSRGGPLFVRRSVHTEQFSLSSHEHVFYRALCDYLRDGYDLASQLGGKASSLGLVMTIFQKIASSSFAAVQTTLRRRLLMLTIREAIDSDERLDVDRRDTAYAEARAMIAVDNGLDASAMDRAQIERLLADAKLAILRRMNEEATSDISSGDEASAGAGEERAATLVATALPEERRRISDLLDRMPKSVETKTGALLSALRSLWAIDPTEKIVIFTTYLGSVEALRTALASTFPIVHIDVLKGGDHGAKAAAQRRFKAAPGPAVLICTAAGREGINLQFCRVLFNHDLPWNPMDLEQRIGRIHRYGQQDTAQVYNLVSADTIEGQVYSLLEEKLANIASTLGRVDNQGQVAEDFRGQILGQLAEQLRYDELYRASLRDPSMKRTKEELAVAMDNAMRARQIVGDLFQDLERFSLDEYRDLDDGGESMARLIAFCAQAATAESAEWTQSGENCFRLVRGDAPAIEFTSDREKAIANDALALLGLEHPVIRRWVDNWATLPAENRGLCALHPSAPTGVYSCWKVVVQGRSGQSLTRVVSIGSTLEGARQPALEQPHRLFPAMRPAGGTSSDSLQRHQFAHDLLPKMLHRALEHDGVLAEAGHYSASLLAWIEITPGQAAAAT